METTRPSLGSQFLAAPWVLVCAAVLSGCGRDSAPASTSPPPPPAAARWFENITARSGLQFTHDADPTGKYLVPEQMGSGCALLDYDNDGRLDVYLIQNAGPDSKVVNRLFHQEPDGRFQDVSRGSGLDVSGFGMGVAIGDVNNDGWPDVLVTEYRAVRLFLNQGGRRFTEVTAGSGLDNPRWATAASFLDYDRDGWLDLVVVNYLDYDPNLKCPDARGVPDFCGPHGFPGSVAKLFRNRGAEKNAATTNPGGPPLFEDGTVTSGLAAATGRGLGVLCADFNGDGWPDIFIADDSQPNRLFLNGQNGRFTEEGALRGVALNAMGQPAANMGIAIGDVDGDGLFDLFVTHLTEEAHALWMQKPRGLFQDRLAGAGLARQGWRGTGFGALFGDFDQDGALDLAFVNGRVQRGPESAPRVPGTDPFWAVYAQRNQIFANDGAGKFRDVSEYNPDFCAQAAVGRGLAMGDLDNDGALDLLVTSTGGPAQLFRNIAPQRGHWLTIRALLPAHGGRDACGAEIIVQAGGRRWWRLAQPAFSYLSSNDPRVHFGLGPVATVDSIQILWPDGRTETFPGGPADRALVLRQGSGTIIGTSPKEKR